MAPCQVEYRKCGKVRCDENCRTCIYYIPTKEDCMDANQLLQMKMDGDPYEGVAECILVNPSDELTPKQLEYQKEKKREYDRKWRKRKKVYTTKYKRRYRELQKAKKLGIKLKPGERLTK